MANGQADRSYIVRLRAGALLLAALVIFSAVGGNFVARQFSLGWAWGAVIALVIALALGVVIARINPNVYFGIAVGVTLLASYFAYDFCTGALDWSGTVSLIWAVLVAVLVAAAFYDFRQIRNELRRWVFPH